MTNPPISNGLTIDRLEEYDSLDWKLVPMMEKIDGRFYMPGELRDKIPLMYSIGVHKAKFPTFPTQ